MFLRLFEQLIRRADSRADWIAGNNSATKTPMMAITTKSSTKVKPVRWFLSECLGKRKDLTAKRDAFMTKLPIKR